MTSGEELSGLAGWAVGLMETLGGPGAALAITAESLFPPIPSEVILPMAGFTASQGSFSLIEALFWTTLGSVSGAMIVYTAGATLGRDRLRTLWAKLPLVELEDLDRAEEWFAKHGRKAVFFGRMVPVIRSLISMPAGVERMPLPLFLMLTTAGSLVWNTAFVMAGFMLGEQWHRVEPYADVFQGIVIGIAVVALGCWTFVLVRRHRARART